MLAPRKAQQPWQRRFYDFGLTEGAAKPPVGVWGRSPQQAKKPFRARLGEALAKPDVGYFSNRPEGRGGKALTFLGVCIYTPYLAPAQKTPKRLTHKTKQTKGKK